MNAIEQLRIFSLFFIIGLFLGLLFTIFKEFRKNFKLLNSKILVDIQDLVFLGISGFAFLKSVVIFNDGTLRFYIFFATILGFLNFMLTLSEGCAIILHVFLNTVFKLFKVLRRRDDFKWEIFLNLRNYLVIIIYTIIYFVNQQKKLDKYESEKAYYQTQIDELKAEQNELKSEQNNMSSPDYIEEQARDKMDMYYPNEKIYIAQ